MKNKPTIIDVAKMAGVAISTVSHVLNGTAPITRETKDRVNKAIRTLNYKPNALARGLRIKHTKLLGLIVPDITVEFYADFAKGVIEKAYAESYTVVLCSTQYDLKRETMEIQALMERRVDGLIFVGGGGDEKQISDLLNSGLPVVLSDRYLPGCNVATVNLDNKEATKKIVRHMKENSFKKIGYISEPLIMTNLQERFAGYRAGLEENGLSYDPSIVFIDQSLQMNKLDTAYALMHNLLKNNYGNGFPDAFVTTSDLVAAGVVNAIKGFGLKIPEDVGVSGFDDIVLASYITPSLTTIAQEKVMMGEKSADLILKALNEKDAPVQNILIEPKLIIRNSC